MLKDGDITYYNQPLMNFHLPTCWDECLAQSDFRNQQQLVRQFNRSVSCNAVYGAQVLV